MVLKFDISNTKITDNDISKSDKVNYDMLLYIIKQGRPISVWEVKEKRKMNQPTVLNNFKKLKESGFIEIFERQPRNRHAYGITWMGLCEFCYINYHMNEEVPKIINAWFEHEKFRKTLQEGIKLSDNQILFGFGPIVTKDPSHAKKLLKKMVEYMTSVWRYGEDAVENPDTWLFYRTIIGEMELLRIRPELRDLQLEFYSYVKFYRDNMERGNQNINDFKVAIEENKPKFTTPGTLEWEYEQRSKKEKLAK